MVTENFTNVAHVGRFGWKDDHASLRGFSGDAYLNEMGITNPDNPGRKSAYAPQTRQAYGVQLEDTGVEDTTDPNGRADIDRFSDFMRGLAPPPTLPQNASARNGSTLFTSMGCAGCHTASMTTASNPTSFIAAATGGAPISQTLNQTPREQDVSSVFGLSAARHGIAGRRHHVGRRGADHDANGASVGPPREVTTTA